MNKLIVTISCDGSVSYPGNPHNILPIRQNVKVTVDEYVRSVEAGAAIVHLHGVRELEPRIQPDGRRLSRLDLDGWRIMTNAIRDQTGAIVQFGVAGARLEDRAQLMPLAPEMMSVAMNAHDEYFQPDPDREPNCIYALHPLDELRDYAKRAREHSIKLEAEAFHTGAFWNIAKLRSERLLDDPVWTTLFLNWQGGSWSPPTEKTLLYLVDHLPEGAIWNVSVMDPVNQWKLLSMAIGLGGHVRVGYEDNPYLEPGILADTNARLVEKIVALSSLLGRDVATPDEARHMIGVGPMR